MLEQLFSDVHADRVRSCRVLHPLTHFATTRWSLIRAEQASHRGPADNDALAELCQIYWRPIFTFVCRRGYSVADAQDLTQDFFVEVLEGKLIQSADPGRGRFRCLLLKSLTNFLIDRKVKSRRRKRGGTIQFIPWDDWMDEASARETLSTNDLAQWSDETLFDFRWASTLVERALHRLREECESKGHRRLFEVLSDCLAADWGDISYRHLSMLLGVSEASVKKLIHRFRVRYRVLLREEVAKTVKTPEQVHDEVRYLCSALSSGTCINGNESM
jgi:DNA-directed RNA polymerase specialized sigma24 family protein